MQYGVFCFTAVEQNVCEEIKRQKTAECIVFFLTISNRSPRTFPCFPETPSTQGT